MEDLSIKTTLQFNNLTLKEAFTSLEQLKQVNAELQANTSYQTGEIKRVCFIKSHFPVEIELLLPNNSTQTFIVTSLLLITGQFNNVQVSNNNATSCSVFLTFS